MDEQETEVRSEFQVERIAFFSDAIFAIAITLLVLEIEAHELTLTIPIAVRLSQRFPSRRI